MGVMFLSALASFGSERWRHCQSLTHTGLSCLFGVFLQFGNKCFSFVCLTLARPAGGTSPGRAAGSAPSRGYPRAPVVASPGLGPGPSCSWVQSWPADDAEGRPGGWEDRVRVKPRTGDEVKPPRWPHPFPARREKRETNGEQTEVLEIGTKLPESYLGCSIDFTLCVPCQCSGFSLFANARVAVPFCQGRSGEMI